MAFSFCYSYFVSLFSCLLLSRLGSSSSRHEEKKSDEEKHKKLFLTIATGETLRFFVSCVTLPPFFHSHFNFSFFFLLLVWQQKNVLLNVSPAPRRVHGWRRVSCLKGIVDKFFFCFFLVALAVAFGCSTHSRPNWRCSFSCPKRFPLIAWSLKPKADEARGFFEEISPRRSFSSPCTSPSDETLIFKLDDLIAVNSSWPNTKSIDDTRLMTMFKFHRRERESD